MFNNIVFTFQKNATFKKISFTLNRLTKKTSRGFSFFETFIRKQSYKSSFADSTNYKHNL
ncbi:hypothetical protein TFKS16_0545 [Tannerella forsythia KS16]|jgi:hypothetical protein|uniref:Uncharacterized protein n=2 Tax=Tannerella forsythia TaxID=28112 RepID=G8UKE9_TANFA|nr:hypothetical protein BFO_0393 [Tannerella forsythia 92A2]SCQ17999.1 hypothetical protein TFUB4_00251 [Tannerella forsythia]BAR47923.1 hypothetical protein TF3313_0332 [Tannerella forsythia 3313]BAR50854.1 hypothetical protein TFKS16_0545 [Tannerella forsythia KS16]SCQ18387.1 hypothetical protein TFUB20_00342 [Tannerella forsythia]